MFYYTGFFYGKRFFLHLMGMKYGCILLITVLLFSCREKKYSFQLPAEEVELKTVPASVGLIPLPKGYKRVAFPENSLAVWLRGLSLKSDKTVYLFNGQLKKNQTAQYAVLDMPRSTTDLQQCADVVMRLRAEYLFREKKYDEIRFTDFEGRSYEWEKGDDRKEFEKYLDLVFGWCGSASLEKQLKPVGDFNTIEPGDVLIRGGFPGHAVIVADLAINPMGEKCFLLIQGYQPAQDMHILVNPISPERSPWYPVSVSDTIYTPEWVFYTFQLRRW